MKKIVLLLTIMPIFSGWAQDTVTDFLSGDYFFNNLPNMKEYNAINGANICGDTCGVICKRLVTGKEPIKVYGVAAAMITPLDMLYLPPDVDTAEFWEGTLEFYADTSLVNAYEYVGIYIRSGDSLEVQQQKLIHRMYDTPSYYVRPDSSVWVFGGLGRNPVFVFPMYEKYFDSVIAVSDTFYVGSTQRSQEGGYGTWRHIGLSVLCYFGSAYNRDYIAFKYCYPNEGSVHWVLEREEGMEQEDFYMMMFPILTPEGGISSDDTTTAVTQADMMARYVAVQPNPAVSEARVLSSFGLTLVEAFDAGGRRLLSLPATGYEAVLDVASWPRGTYILRITTPLGPVTKKLLVQ